MEISLFIGRSQHVQVLRLSTWLIDTFKVRLFIFFFTFTAIGQ